MEKCLRLKPQVLIMVTRDPELKQKRSNLGS